MDVVELSAEPLVLERYITAVSDDGAGAISTFIGVTRDTFDGKKVVRLEYEAYNEMVRSRLPKLLSVLTAQGLTRQCLLCPGAAGAARCCRAYARALAA